MKKIISVVVLCWVRIFSFASDSTGVKLSVDQKRINDQEVLLTIKAEIPNGLKLYGIKEPGKMLCIQQ